MLQIFKYQESPIQFEEVDGILMANATLMCKPFGKISKDWLKSEQTKRYIAAISDRIKIPSADLVRVKKGGMDQGTWIHEKLILPLARFLSVDFEIWCDERIAELMRNGVTSVDGKLGKVVDAMMALAETTKMAMDSVRSLTDRVSNLEKSPTKQKIETIQLDIVDARHRKFYVTDRNGGQMRCIKLDDKEWFSMADVLLILKCRTSPQQYARSLNRNGMVNAQKIWLFGQSREQWFVSEDGLNLLLSRA